MSPMQMSPLEEPAMPERQTPMSAPDALRQPQAATARIGIQVIALVVLAIAAITAFYSANVVVDIWFDYQYAAIVRLAIAVATVLGMVWVLIRVSGRKK